MDHTWEQIKSNEEKQLFKHNFSKLLLLKEIANRFETSQTNLIVWGSCDIENSVALKL